MIYIYLFDVISSLAVAAGIATIAGIIIAFFAGGIAYIEDDTELRKLGKYALIVAVIAGFLSVFIPSKSTMYAMGGVYIAETIANTDQATELGQKSIKVLNGFLDERIAEMEDGASQ